jgi:hypothetical protein
MITEIEMRFTEREDEAARMAAGLVRFERAENIVTIGEPETGVVISMHPQEALDLAAKINKMLEIVGGTL